MNYSENYPFPSRPGTKNEITLTLDSETRPKLSPEQLVEVLNFEKGLYELSLDSKDFPKTETYRAGKQEVGQPLERLEDVWNAKVNRANLGVNYFSTVEGKNAILGTMGVHISDDASEESIKSTLAGLDIHDVDSKTLDTLEADSLKYEEERVAKQFIDSGYKSDGVDTPEIVTVFKNPEVIVRKANGYRAVKAYISHAIEDINSHKEKTPVTDAQLVIAELYRRRVNMFLLSTYVDAYKLYSQNRSSDKTIHEEVISELESILPAFNTSFEDDSIAHFMQRIDRMQQGVDRDENGDFTFLSPEAKKLAKSAEEESKNNESIDRGDYSPISPEELAETKIDGDTFGGWVSDVLSTYGLLSSSTEWSSDRTRPAQDSKWQVIVNDKFKSLAVNDKQRVVEVPKKVYSLVQALSLISHEIVHVLQHENKRAIGDMEILKRIGFDSPSEQTESGGKWQEAVAREKLTGQKDTDVAGTSYLKALEVKASGGSFAESLKAFYEDFRLRMPELTSEETAIRAVNRTRRIYRGGGFEFAQGTDYLTDTQPLNYLEQKLIYESLKEDDRKLLYLGGVAIANFMKLAEVGLVDVNKINIPEKKPLDILRERVSELIESR